jgi:HD-GYP domain-containing protein (c-di-GMP phosphodiesterase class II)
MELHTKNIVNIIGNTLNLIDGRLVDHGARVAELVVRAIRLRGGYTETQQRDICMLALIHDIGAYKTEQIDRIVHFETTKVWEHSIYGYLFIKLLTPLGRLAPAVFFHHADCSELQHLHPSYHELAQILHLADRVDILASRRGGIDSEVFHRYFDPHRDQKFCGGVIDLFDRAMFAEAQPGSALERFGGIPLSAAEAGEYLYMMALSIDFRSPQTVTHTVGVMRIADWLAGRMGMDADERKRIGLGAMLHDLGKQGIPLDILEAPGSLSPEQMDVMRTHVKMSEDILKGNVDDRVMRIAVRHHEKLTGNGYHLGLSESDLTPAERLVAVSDVLSALLGRRSYKEPFPKERVLAIMDSMAKARALDADIVSLAMEYHDEVAGVMGQTAVEAEAMYAHINEEFASYLARTDHLGRGGLVLSQELEW